MIQTIIEVMPDEQRASAATMNRQFKRILGHPEPKGFAEWLVASADWREKCLKSSCGSRPTKTRQFTKE